MRIQVEKGQTLYEALEKQNMVLERPCDGRGTCGGCSVLVQGFGKVKSCQFRLPGTYEVELLEQTAFDIVGSGMENQLVGSGSFPFTEEPQVALDLGTTTVAYSVFYKGEESSGGFVNPQRIYGADVMSRIKNATQGHLEDMQTLIQGAVREHLDGVIREMVHLKTNMPLLPYRMCIAANTTMLHIWNGWSCEGLGKAPYVPVSVQMQKNEANKILQFPGISAYVGADIVSGIYALDLHKSKEPVLLLDLGTNAEMVLGCQNHLLVTSAAAGPAFEGTPLALKLHASGIMERLVRMRQLGIMDETGYLKQEEYGDIVQEDIRQIQMAKSAIYSGILLLTEAYGIKLAEIKNVYLAGGMGYYLNPDHAIAIGLLPEVFRGKIIPVGNTSLTGTKKFLREQQRDSAMCENEVIAIPTMAQELVLAKHPKFEECFMEHMGFEGKRCNDDK